MNLSNNLTYMVQYNKEYNYIDKFCYKNRKIKMFILRQYSNLLLRVFLECYKMNIKILSNHLIKHPINNLIHNNSVIN